MKKVKGTHFHEEFKRLSHPNGFKTDLTANQGYAHLRQCEQKCLMLMSYYFYPDKGK